MVDKNIGRFQQLALTPTMRLVAVPSFGPTANVDPILIDPLDLDGENGAPGEDGAPGSLYYLGAGAPDDTLGRDNDQYTDIETGDVYWKQAGVYVYQYNAKGIPGNDGVDGALGPVGPKGEDGLPGAPGEQGPEGPRGIQGAGLLPDEYGDLDEAKIAAIEADDMPWVFVVNPEGDLRADQNAPAGLSGDQERHIIRYEPGVGWKDYGFFTGVAGPEGPRGPQGIQGQQGIQGPAGEAGKSVMSGPTDPSPNEGGGDSIYLNLVSGDTFKKTFPPGAEWQKIGNFKGPQGIAGTDGTNGATIRRGNGTPSNGLGKDGDYYIDLSTFILYGKSAGTYTNLGSIKGQDGATIRQGVGIPAASLGNDGDVYINRTTFVLYTKAAGAWTATGNLQGATIRNGTGVPDNATGNDGDYYLNTTSYDFSQRIGGSYTVIGNLKGLAGTNGKDGENGSTIRTGTDAPPANGIGKDGDLYLNTTTYMLYGKANGAYSEIGSLKGANGTVTRTGAADPASGLGANGDLYINTTSYDLFLKASGAYSKIGNIKGTNGTVTRTGTGAPAAGLGNDGDLYINLSTYDLYSKTAGAWAVIGNIKGGVIPDYTCVIGHPSAVATGIYPVTPYAPMASTITRITHLMGPSGAANISLLKNNTSVWTGDVTTAKQNIAVNIPVALGDSLDIQVNSSTVKLISVSFG